MRQTVTWTVPCALAPSGEHAVGLTVEVPGLTAKTAARVRPGTADYSMDGVQIRAWCDCDRNRAGVEMLDSLSALGQYTCRREAQRIRGVLSGNVTQPRLYGTVVAMHAPALQALSEHAAALRGRRRRSAASATPDAGERNLLLPRYRRGLAASLHAAILRAQPGILRAPAIAPGHPNTQMRWVDQLCASLRVERDRPGQPELALRVTVEGDDGRGVLHLSLGRLGGCLDDAGYRAVCSPKKAGGLSYCPVCDEHTDKPGVHARTIAHREKVRQVLRAAWGRLRWGRR